VHGLDRVKKLDRKRKTEGGRRYMKVLTGGIKDPIKRSLQRDRNKSRGLGR